MHLLYGRIWVAKFILKLNVAKLSFNCHFSLIHSDLRVGHLILHFHCVIIVAKCSVNFKMHSEPNVQQNGDFKCLLFFLNALILTLETFQLHFHYPAIM